MAGTRENSALAAIAGAPLWLILASFGGIWLLFRGPRGVKDEAKDILGEIARDVGAGLVKPFEVLGILGAMAKEAHDRDLETEQMRRVIPSREQGLAQVHAFVLNQGYLKMSQLSFLISALDEYERLKLQGHSEWYSTHALAQGQAIMNLVRKGLPVFFDFDLELKQALEKAKETGKVDVDFFESLKPKILTAEARHNSSDRWSPWNRIMSPSGLAAAISFRNAIEKGDYKLV